MTFFHDFFRNGTSRCIGYGDSMNNVIVYIRTDRGYGNRHKKWVNKQHDCPANVDPIHHIPVPEWGGSVVPSYTQFGGTHYNRTGQFEKVQSLMCCICKNDKLNVQSIGKLQWVKVHDPGCLIFSLGFKLVTLINLGWTIYSLYSGGCMRENFITLRRKGILNH